MRPQERQSRTSLPRRLHFERDAEQLCPPGGTRNRCAELRKELKHRGVRIRPPRLLAGGRLRVGLACGLRERMRPVGSLEA
jgi:hypothetical protein